MRSHHPQPAAAQDRWRRPPAPAEREVTARLLLAHHNRAATANAPGYHGDLANALDWLSLYSATTPSRELLVRNLTAEDSEYNAITFGCLFEFIREKGSKQRGALYS